MQIPDADALAELKAKDPQAHKVFLKQFDKQMDHQRFMESAQFRMPLRVMQTAQISALIAIIIFAVLAGFALWLDHPWVATLFGVLDVTTIVGLFLAPSRAIPRGNDNEDDD